VPLVEAGEEDLAGEFVFLGPEFPVESGEAI